MGLKDRVHTLRRQTGAVADTAAPRPGESVAERIERLRAGGAAKPRPRLDVAALAAELGAEQLDEQLIYRRQVLTDDACHGDFPLRALAEPVGSLSEAAALEPGQLLFVDTETSGLAGGTGTVAYLLGLAVWRDGALEVHQYLITAFAGEAALYRALAPWLEELPALASYNGKSFDLPLIKDRARLQGLRLELEQRPHLDLLHPTRRAYGSRWPDCRLASAERRLLGFLREDDLPGWEAPQVWFDLLRGDTARVGAVLRHNYWDLVSLALLLPALAAVHADPLRHGADPLALARWRQKSGDAAGALELLEQGRDGLDQAGLRELARLYRRRGDWPAAAALWRQLAASGCTESLECLAKHAEHVDRDLAAAAELAARLPAGPERSRRLQRLQRKLPG